MKKIILKSYVLSDDHVEEFVSNKIGMMFGIVPAYCELFERFVTYFWDYTAFIILCNI